MDNLDQARFLLRDQGLACFVDGLLPGVGEPGEPMGEEYAAPFLDRLG